jgi:hypothetical protein
MDINGFIGAFSGGLKDGESKRYIGYKYSVHYIKMYPFGGRLIDHVKVFFKIAKITGK